jgi:hypothetical protein
MVSSNACDLEKSLCFELRKVKDRGAVGVGDLKRKGGNSGKIHLGLALEFSVSGAEKKI